MALNSGGFSLTALPTAPTGVGELGKARSFSDTAKDVAAGMDLFEKGRTLKQTAALQDAKDAYQTQLQKGLLEVLPSDLAAQKAANEASAKFDPVIKEMAARASVVNTAKGEALSRSDILKGIAKNELELQQAQAGKEVLPFQTQAEIEKEKAAGVKSQVEGLRATPEAEALKTPEVQTGLRGLAAGGVEQAVQRQSLAGKALQAAAAGENEITDKDGNVLAVRAINPITGASETFAPSAAMLARQRMAGSTVQNVPVIDPSTGKQAVDEKTGSPLFDRIRVDKNGNPIETLEKSAPISSAPVSASQRVMDNAFAKEVVDFRGREVNQEASVKLLNGAIDRLKETDLASGAIAGRIPSVIKFFTDKPSGIQADIETAIQPQLRQIYGSQFTEAEGQRFFARLFDPKVDEAENARRAENLRDSLQGAIKAKQDQIDYFEANGTLRGYSGPKIPDLTSLESKIVGTPVPVEKSQPAAAQDQRAEAMQWLKENPTDPRAAAIKATLDL